MAEFLFLCSEICVYGRPTSIILWPAGDDNFENLQQLKRLWSTVHLILVEI